jgi:hypothetical protein
MSSKRIVLSFESEEAFWSFVRNPGGLKLHQIEVEKAPQPSPAAAPKKRRYRRKKATSGASS